MAKEKKFLLLAVAIVVLLRLPSLTDPKYYLDEGVYASVAYEVGEGGTLYQTTWDLKPPGIFLGYLFFQKLFGSHAFLVQRVFNIVLGILAVFGVYKLAKLLKAPRSVVATASFLTAVCLGLPFFETQIFNTENVFVVTSLFAFIAGLKFKDRWREPFIAGILFGVGQWLKIHPLFDLAAFGLFALYQFRFNKKFWIPFIIGFLAPLLALLLYLVNNGILTDFWETNFSYNLFYVGELPQITVFGGLLKRTVLLFGATTILFALKVKKKISENTLLLFLWFLFVFYGALLSARAYGHYFIPTLIPTVLLLSLLIRKKSFLILLTLLPFLLYPQNFLDGQIHFYQHRLSYLTGKIDKHEFEKDFTPKPWRLRELKAYLDTNIPKDDRVYIWGISPFANYVLDRRPVQKYLMWFHILGVGNREEEVYQDLLSKMPEIIIVEDNQPEGESYQISRPPFPKLQTLIDTNYKFEAGVAGYNIHKRITLALK